MPVPPEPRLTAYLVPKSPENPPQIDTVRAHAASRLPDYMVPASFQILPALPLTNNGKLDLKALPAAENTPPKFHRAKNTHRRQTRRAASFAPLPNHPGGVLDHFFEAGGDSLIAIRFLYAINAQLGVSLPLQSVFELPTIAALASHIDSPSPGRHLAVPTAGKAVPRNPRDGLFHTVTLFSSTPDFHARAGWESYASDSG